MELHVKGYNGDCRDCVYYGDYYHTVYGYDNYTHKCDRGDEYFDNQYGRTCSCFKDIADVEQEELNRIRKDNDFWCALSLPYVLGDDEEDKQAKKSSENDSYTSNEESNIIGGIIATIMLIVVTTVVIEILIWIHPVVAFIVGSFFSIALSHGAWFPSIIMGITFSHIFLIKFGLYGEIFCMLAVYLLHRWLKNSGYID